jgi:hypothetical protein
VQVLTSADEMADGHCHSIGGIQFFGKVGKMKNILQKIGNLFFTGPPHPGYRLFTRGVHIQK